jgi:V/A-type H+-transporting ATPase subunit F
MHKQIAAIGSADSMMAFAALGIHTVGVEEALEAERIIFELAREGTAVIFIDEIIAREIPQVLARYLAQPYPAIIAIPTGPQSAGFGLAQLRANVERALGADILFGKEG